MNADTESAWDVIIPDSLKLNQPAAKQFLPIASPTSDNATSAPIPAANHSNATFDPERDDPLWPGATELGDADILINIRADDYPQEVNIHVNTVFSSNSSLTAVSRSFLLSDNPSQPSMKQTSNSSSENGLLRSFPVSDLNISNTLYQIEIVHTQGTYRSTYATAIYSLMRFPSHLWLTRRW
jgi:hypothetical protein